MNLRELKLKLRDELDKAERKRHGLIGGNRAGKSTKAAKMVSSHQDAMECC